jgi:hypothetical protein
MLLCPFQYQASIVKVIAMPLMSELEMKNAIEFNSLWENLTQLPGTD